MSAAASLRDRAIGTPTTERDDCNSVAADLAPPVTGISFADVDACGASILATFTVASDKLWAMSGGNLPRLAAEMTNLPNQIVEVASAHLNPEWSRPPVWSSTANSLTVPWQTSWSKSERGAMARKKAVLKEFSEPLDDVLTSAHYPWIPPIGDGTMTMSAAIHWIATEGLQVDLAINIAGPRYVAAAIALRDKIILNKVKSYGENSDRDFEEIPGIAFLERKFTFDFEAGVEDIAGRENRIEVSLSEDGDCLFRANSFRAVWTHLMVRREDIRREWEFAQVASIGAGRGKKPLIKQYLRENFPNGVPTPAIEPRKGLKGKIETSDLATKHPQLGSIDYGTLKSAIDDFNAEFQQS